jgi:hypothetical protein
MLHDTVVEKVSLSKRLLCDYKEQKAFRYFCSRFLFNIYFHDIPSSDYCFLKTKCMPSQRLSEIPHDVWACLEKSTGRIIAAYCTRLAGLGQTCNHVVAMLLIVDFQWKVGAVQKACTSLPCSWNQGGKSLTVEPTRLADVEIKKPVAEKLQSDRSLNSAAKKPFSPGEQSKGMSFDMLLQKLQELKMDSVTLGERSPQRHEVYKKEDMTANSRMPSISLPPSVSELAAVCNSVEELMNKLNELTPGDIANIEKATRGQGSNVDWLHQRLGMKVDK